MEAYARAPDPLTKDGDMANNWQIWKEDFIIFMKVTGIINKSNEDRANFLKNRIGKIGIEAIQSIPFDNVQDENDMDILIQKLEEYFNPKKEAVERYHFFTRTRKQNESIEQYINILKEKAKTCNFDDMTENIIRDKIILDTHDKILRKKFFEADNLDLQKLVMIYNDYNINTEKMKQVTRENTVESASFIQKPLDNNVKKGCWRCGHQHPQGKCFAWGSKCTKCGDVNHFTHCCKGFRFKTNNDKVTRENTAESASFTQKPLDNNVKKGCWRCGHQHPQGKCFAWGSKCTKCGDVNHFTHCCKGFRFKTNNDKVNKNLLYSMQQTTLTSKNNDKWNNQADFAAKTTDAMKKMISFPDIPATPCDASNLTVGNDSTSDFITVNTHNKSPKLCYNNTMRQSAPENAQYSHLYIKEAEPDWVVTDLYNRHEKVQPKPKQTKIEATSQISDKKKFKNDQKKKSNKDTCILS